MTVDREGSQHGTFRPDFLSGARIRKRHLRTAQSTKSTVTPQRSLEASFRKAKPGESGLRKRHLRTAQSTKSTVTPQRSLEASFRKAKPGESGLRKRHLRTAQSTVDGDTAEVARSLVSEGEAWRIEASLKRETRLEPATSTLGRLQDPLISFRNRLFSAT